MYSSELERLIKFLKQCKADYDWHYNMVGTKDKEICDLEHEMRLAGKDKDRMKAARKLVHVLRERGSSKDIVQITEPIAQFVEANKTVINQMDKMLGQVRKTEKSQDNRQYMPRIRKDLTICKGE